MKILIFGTRKTTCTEIIINEKKYITSFSIVFLMAIYFG